MNIKEYFRSQKIGRGKKYHPDSVELLRRIVGLYDTDHETTDIKKILADEYAFIIEDVSNETITQPPHYDISGKLDSFQQKQDDFNKMLLKQLDEQQKYIEELIKSKNENTDELKQLTSPEEKRIERLEQIMAERKVSRILEEEALELWREKSEEERLDRKSTRLNSSHVAISYSVFCL